MILATLIAAAVGVATVGILSYFWDDIKNWLHYAINWVKRTVRGIVYGAKVFIRKMREAYEEISKTYHQDENKKWHETTTTREVPESEVPPEIRAKARVYNQEVDITEELEKELELVV
jgi:hypothetical protein